MRSISALVVGFDIVDIRDVEAALSTFGDRYLQRVYTAHESTYAKRAPADVARRLGARFAAKEATIKALGASEVGIDPRDIEVLSDSNGACLLHLTGRALAAQRRAGVDGLALSVTHEGSLAAAVVVGQRKQRTRARPHRKRGTSRAFPRTGARRS